jgi:cytoskeletal protein CcmA (bactofilin family)
MTAFLKRLLSARIERVAPEENFFISSGMEFYGDLVARSSSGRIDGRFEGQIIECRRIIIGPDAMIKGNVFAEDILLYGYCEGNLFASGDVKVFNTAVILGDIHSASLLVEKESTFRGNVKKLKPEDMAEFAIREKEKIIKQGRSNVHNIYSLKAKLESDEARARKVANGLAEDIPDTGNRTVMKRVEVAEVVSEPASASVPESSDVRSNPVRPEPTQRRSSVTTAEVETERRWF